MVFFNFFCFLCVQYGRLSSSWFCCHADIIFVKIPYSHTVKDNVGGGGGGGGGKGFKGVLSWRSCCILCKTAQILDKELFL